MSQSFVAAARLRNLDSGWRLPELRARLATVPGPNPLDCDCLNLALFAVGWALLLRDLR